MSSSAVLDPVRIDTAAGGAPSGFLDDEFWEHNPNINSHTVDQAEVDEYYRQKARRGERDATRLLIDVRWEIMEYRSTLPKTLPKSDVASAAPKHPKKRSFIDALCAWLTQLFRSGQVLKGEIVEIPLGLTSREHHLLMKQGVIPANADGRKLNCAQLGRVLAIRGDATA